MSLSILMLCSISKSQRQYYRSARTRIPDVCVVGHFEAQRLDRAITCVTVSAEAWDSIFMFKVRILFFSIPTCMNIYVSVIVLTLLVATVLHASFQD